LRRESHSKAWWPSPPCSELPRRPLPTNPNPPVSLSTDSSPSWIRGNALPVWETWSCEPPRNQTRRALPR
jgi:hypothetical protein